MTKRRKGGGARGAGRATATEAGTAAVERRSAAAAAPPVAPTPPSRARRVAFTVVTVLFPFLLLGGAELALRAFWKSGALPLFVHGEIAGRDVLVANPRVARRWFSGTIDPPGTIPEPFPVERPAHAVRIFALGESTTAGFPYPHNGAFTRMLADALTDALPGDSVQVINLGIPATNSYALVDEIDEVLAQRPDAVVIYAGHNEYYGALGVGSTQSLLGGHPALVRAYLRLQRLRLVLALRDGLARVRGAFARHDDAEAPTFMELLARDQQIALDGPTYRRGERQFADNLDVVLGKLRAAHVPAFVASQASNLRDQHPFVSSGNLGAAGADTAYARAQRALAAGDTAAARPLFTRARDLDVVRFRAPSAFNEVIQQRAAANGAVYVPVAERFAQAATAGIPGRDLFLEHVHPNERGATIIAQAFFDAIAQGGFLGRTATVDRVRPWSEYERRMALTPFDERVVAHSVQTVTRRWPFVAVAQQVDYRRLYRPTSFLDSLSLMVAAGAPWGQAKLQMANDYQRRGFPDSAVAELRGVVRDSPEFADPWEMLGQALMKAHEDDSAAVAFDRALAIGPSASAARSAAELALKRKELPRAVALLRESLSLQPDDPTTLYQLSLAYALMHDVANARAVATRLRMVAPTYPGLAPWLRLLGLAN